MAEHIVIALGGNALGNTPSEQKKKVKTTAHSIVDLIEAGNRVSICHGNGPQVGLIKKSMDIASQADSSIESMPFPECGAMSQAYIGYHLQQALCNELASRSIDKQALAVVSQVRVDPEDPAFQKPTKPIGQFMSQEKAKNLEAQGLNVMEDAGRGYRQVVASPKPIEFIEGKAIEKLVEAGFVVIAGGGGGIPVIEKNGSLVGVPAVIDKDWTSALLAETVAAKKLIILTAVDQVAIHFGKPDQKNLDQMTVKEAQGYIEAGEFAPGSMLPKIQAALSFVQKGDGRRALITSLERASEALEGKTGTWIVA